MKYSTVTTQGPRNWAASKQEDGADDIDFMLERRWCAKTSFLLCVNDRLCV